MYHCVHSVELIEFQFSKHIIMNVCSRAVCVTAVAYICCVWKGDTKGDIFTWSLTGFPPYYLVLWGKLLVVLLSHSQLNELE